MKKENNQNIRPLVTVLFITYNHIKYVKQAIESILMQQTDFDFQIIAGDDASTDGTREIVLQIAEENPGKIILSNPPVNLGAAKNFIQLFHACSASGSKYIAYLEGDDYWTDPLKLQKQVNFLEKNDDFVLCFSKVDILKEKESEVVHYSTPGKDVLSFKDLIFAHYIPTLSIMFRNMIDRLPDWYSKVRSGDRALEMMLAMKGKTKYMDECQGVYREHNAGITSTKNHEFKPNDDAYFIFKNLLRYANGKQFVYLIYIITKNRVARTIRKIAGIFK